MHDLIDIYQKKSDRWGYIEGTRMHKTLKAAIDHYANTYGTVVQARFA